jgi:hypothetical protein
MSGCDRVIEVEDMVLGLGTSDDLEAHVESCADCKGAREMFQAERALFAARPVPLEPPSLVLPKPMTARVYRFVPALAAVAACFVFFIGRPHADDCDEPAPSSVVRDVAGAVSDEPAICRAPSESPAPAVSLASHDTNACVPSPNATCDVTSSTAMP